MTSILTNAGAISALHVLRNIATSMDQTQTELAAGLRISRAADNAAYWSIATTMRSDDKAVSAVSDALGLGSALVDVAYTGMNDTVDVLDEVKAKLVAASEPGVDRAKIQKEIVQLQDQARTIAQSSSFNGTNWLDTDIADIYNEQQAMTEIVASFSRNATGVELDTLAVNLAKSSLFNTSGGGALQKDAGVSYDPTPVTGDVQIGGLANGVPSTTPHHGHVWFDFTGPHAFSGSEEITFNITVDASAYSSGQTYTGVMINQALINTTLSKTDGLIANATEYAQVIDAALAVAGVPAGSALSGYAVPNVVSGSIDIGSDETLAGHPGSSIAISDVQSNLTTGGSLGLDSIFGRHNNLYASAGLAFTQGISFDTGTSSFSFDVTFGAGAPTNIVVTKADVDAALGTTNGTITSAQDFAQVLNSKASGLLFSGYGTYMSISADPSVHPEQGGKSDFTITNVTQTGLSGLAVTQPGFQLVDFDFVDIDITQPGIDIAHYLSGVDVMLSKVTDGAAVLGSLQKRIDIQAEFAEDLRDSFSRGVGRLVDADLDETSTRLKALQAQQQLSIQALQIANSHPETLLQLLQ